MPRLARTITFIASINTFVVVLQLALIGLVFLLMSMYSKIPFAAIGVYIASVVVALVAACSLYGPLFKFTNHSSETTQKVLLAVMVIVSAVVLWGSTVGF